MKKMVLGLVLWALAAPAWAADSYRIGDGYTDREKRRGGGQSYTFENVNARADRLVFTATSGRNELEDIKIEGRDGFKADLVMLQYDDVRNKEMNEHSSRFNPDGRYGEPRSIIVYLPQTVEIAAIEVQMEAWDDNAYVQMDLELGSDDDLPVDEDDTIIPVDPDPVNPPAPQCNVSDLTSSILRCSRDLSNERINTLNMDNNLRLLLGQLEQRDSRIRQCTQRKSQVLNAVQATETWLSEYEVNWDSTANNIRSVVKDNKRLRREIHRVENPAQEWDCYVQSRNGQRWTERGTNRVQMLQKMLRLCGDGKGQCGSKKWYPRKGKGAWGCTPVRNSRYKEPDFAEDKEDDKDVPGERKKTKKRKDRQDRDGERRRRNS